MKKCFSVKETAEALGVTERAVWQRIARGQLPFRRWNRRVIIPTDELERFLATLPGCTAEEAISEIANSASPRNELGENL